MANIYLGKEGVISAKEAAQKQVQVYGATAYPDYVTTFDSNDDFMKWIETLPYKDRLVEALNKTDQARQAYLKDPSAAIEAQRAAIKDIQVKVEALGQELGLDPNSREVFLKATVEADPLRGPIFRSGQCFEHYFSGRRLDIRSWQWLPNLADLGFDDIISSVRVHPWSVVGLFEDSPFGGKWQLFFGGLWWNGEYTLNEEMNDKASSAYCIGI